MNVSNCISVVSTNYIWYYFGIMVDRRKRSDKGLVEANSGNVEVLISTVRRKEEIERDAWEALGGKLKPRVKPCSKCGGVGEFKSGGNCPLCGGGGIVHVEPDMRAVELVLGPKFPKTVVNVNAEIDDMSRDDLLRLIDGM